MAEKEMVFSKTFAPEFHMARTLRTTEVSDLEFEDHNRGAGSYTKTHLSGWTISGEVHTNRFAWVNHFEAKHPWYGYVKGNFEDTVQASSEMGYNHFYLHHTPKVWDYWDI